jgi:hypothetical protein
VTTRINIDDKDYLDLAELKTVTGVSKIRLLHRAVEFLKEQEFPEIYTLQFRLKLKKEFRLEVLQAEDTKLKAQSYIVRNAWADCLKRNFIAYSDDMETPFNIVLHNLKMSRQMIECVTFTEIMPQLMKEYEVFFERCKTPEIFNISVMKLLKYRKEHHINMAEKDIW